MHFDMIRIMLENIGKQYAVLSGTYRRRLHFKKSTMNSKVPLHCPILYTSLPVNLYLGLILNLNLNLDPNP
jgi:hypothetical protein